MGVLLISILKVTSNSELMLFTSSHTFCESTFSLTMAIMLMKRFLRFSTFCESVNSVDNLVATDHNMEQEIYASGYAKKHTCWFTDWNILPGDVATNVLMGYDIPEEFVFQNSQIGRTSCVIQGKDPALVQEKLNEAIKMNPDRDAADLKMKMEKDVGIWITWVDEDDSVINFDFPRGWSAGNSAMHLACQNTAKKVYLLGFDLSIFGQPLNNVYKDKFPLIFREVNDVFKRIKQMDK